MSYSSSNKIRLFVHPAFCGLLLGFVTLWVYWPVKDCDFLGYDDPGYFSANPHVLGGFTPASVVWAFTNGDAANWHPFTWLSLMLDAEFFGDGPAGPHLVNLLLHAVDAVLLLVLFHRLTGKLWLSALVAALFALHPLHVESVAWVAERKDVLSLFFELLALLAYVRWVQESPEAASCPLGKDLPKQAKLNPAAARRNYFKALVFFALALMSKPMAVTLPFLLLLLDWWPLGRISEADFAGTFRRRVREKWPFLLLSVLACVVTFIVQQKGGTVASMGEFSIGARLENALVSYARYLGKMIWPSALANPYPHPGHWPWPPVLGAIVLLALCSVVAIACRKQRPYFIVGWFWFVGTLIPVIGLVQVGDQAMADRYSYLPLIGVFMVLVWGAAELGVKCRVPPPFMILAVLVVLTTCGLRTRAQLAFWQNDGTLFSHALAVTKNNYIANINLGAWLSKNDATDEALICYSRALQIKPEDAVALYNLGNIFTKRGDWETAAQHYQAALRRRPDYPEALCNLGVVLTRQKKFPDAAASLEAAIKARPDFADAHNNLGTVRFFQGQYAQAAEHYYRALELSPDNLIYCANTGDALARLGKMSAAVECYQRVLQADPDNQKVRLKLQALTGSAAGLPALPSPK